MCQALVRALLDRSEEVGFTSLVQEAPHFSESIIFQRVRKREGEFQFLLASSGLARALGSLEPGPTLIWWICSGVLPSVMLTRPRR